MIDWRDSTIDVSQQDNSRMRVATLACRVKLSAKTGKASILFTGSADPEVLKLDSTSGGTLYLGGVPVTFGASSAQLKITTPSSKSYSPWNTFTVKVSNVDVTPWQNNGTFDGLASGKPVTLPVMLVSGTTTLFGEAPVSTK